MFENLWKICPIVVDVKVLYNNLSATFGLCGWKAFFLQNSLNI